GGGAPGPRQGGGGAGPGGGGTGGRGRRRRGARGRRRVAPSTTRLRRHPRAGAATAAADRPTRRRRRASPAASPPRSRERIAMDRPISASAMTLPGPFDTDPGRNMTIAPPVSRLVHAQVQALLESSPAFHDLPAERRDRMTRDLEKIAAYTAALVHEEWRQTKALGQTPVVHRRETLVVPQAAGASAPVVAQANKQPPQEAFAPRAASQVAGVTRDTLNAIAFPTFVADLIKGTFQAIVNASIQQMEAYGALLSNVAKTVDQFMADNISDNNARDWAANAHP